MTHDQPVKTQNLKMPNLERGGSPQELAEEEAQQVIGGFSLNLGSIIIEYAPKKDDPSLLQAR